MKRILLCCSAGMSTSLLVVKMEKVAEEKGIEAKIWAVSNTDVRAHLEEADVLLLGPQVRFLLPEMQKECAKHNISVGVIEMTHYGMCNGAAVIEQAEALIANNS